MVLILSSLDSRPTRERAGSGRHHRGHRGGSGARGCPGTAAGKRAAAGRPELPDRGVPGRREVHRGGPGGRRYLQQGELPVRGYQHRQRDLPGHRHADGDADGDREDLEPDIRGSEVGGRHAAEEKAQRVRGAVGKSKRQQVGYIYLGLSFKKFIIIYFCTYF